MAVAGRLRHRIIIEKPTRTKDAAGGTIETFATFAEMWAEIIPTSGDEFFESQRVDTAITHRIRIRHIDGVLPDMRVNFKGRFFDIRRIQHVAERGFDDILICRELIQN